MMILDKIEMETLNKTSKDEEKIGSGVDSRLF